MWQQRGQPTRIPAAGTDERITLFGAVDYRSGVLTTKQATASTAAEFEPFLDQLSERWPDDHLVLVLDNATYHKTAAIRAWFAAHHARISVLWLPTYSPQLNLIERVWRFIKRNLACHRLWNDRVGLAKVAQTLCDATRATFASPTYPHITIGQDL